MFFLSAFAITNAVPESPVVFNSTPRSPVDVLHVTFIAFNTLLAIDALKVFPTDSSS